MNISRSTKREEKSASTSQTPVNYIFKGREYESRGDLWESEGRDGDVSLKWGKVAHSSEPYHKGCTTLYPLSFASPERLKTAQAIASVGQRDMSSPFDETIFYWKNLATEDDVRKVQEHSVNSANHLLKFIGYHWIHALELVSHTLAQSEYFNDDNPATRPKKMKTAEWRREFYKVVEAGQKINYFRRKMIYFEGNMALNLERLGASLDFDVQRPDEDAGKTPRAIVDAQMDFKVLASRLRPLRERANNLSTVANDIASLRAAFQAIEDSASGLSLSILATVIFPFTLVASMLSMPDHYSPGKSHFWIFFAVSVPLSALIILFLILNQDWAYWHDRSIQPFRHVLQRKFGKRRKEEVRMKQLELPL